MDEILAVFERDGFRCELLGPEQYADYGRVYVGYRLYHEGRLIFEGERFSPSPAHAIDSDESFGSLLTFLSLQPGDTDPEYFENYTSEQLEWVAEHGEHLGRIAHELEAAYNL